MAESAFLSAVEQYLRSQPLAPAPATVGVSEPAAGADLPALVLSLERTERASNGLGERSALITNGVLPVHATIDLANPVLPEEPTFTLLDASRTTLTLPHGGLVQADGGDPLGAPLTGDDITVTVAGVGRPVVTAAPAGPQVRVDPTVGQLRFATALPATGTVVVDYVLGQWEQRLERISGVLRLDACAATGAEAGALADGAVAALVDAEARRSVRRLLGMSVVSLSSVGVPEPDTAVRRRTTRLAFGFEHEINRPESSGGIIRVIPITTRMAQSTVHPTTGAITTAVSVVAG